jgi:hypothetical protein
MRVTGTHFAVPDCTKGIGRDLTHNLLLTPSTNSMNTLVIQFKRARRRGDCRWCNNWTDRFWTGRATRGGVRYDSRNRWLPCQRCDRTKLPLAESKFQGTIGKSYSDSKPDWPRVPTPPEGMPNVVVILLDDVGFGQVSTFGGSVPHSRTIRDAPSDKILKSLNISAPDTLGGIDHLDPTDRFQLN